MGDGPGQREVREKKKLQFQSSVLNSNLSPLCSFNSSWFHNGLGTDLSDSNAVGSLPSPGPPSLQSELPMVSGGDGAEGTAVLEEG